MSLSLTQLTNMLKPKTLLLVFVLLVCATWLSSSGLLKKVGSNSTDEKIDGRKATLTKLRNRATDIKKFVSEKGYNDRICFLIDMSLPSGSSRFFVYNLKTDTLQNSGLVTHGRCNQQWLEGRKYGNTVGCGCTSLGKYKIGNSYQGRFGLAFKLYGLDKTNDKAFDRFVVLHSHECVPETDVDDDICQSDGCPTVSPGFLQQLKPIINNSPKPVLLWIFE